MKISNVRLGFACNSSSTHSIIFGLDEDTKVYDCPDQQFGWDEWCAGTKEGLLAYLAQTVRLNLVPVLGDKIALIVAKEWVGVEAEEDGYIDHQSVLSLPQDYERPNVLSDEFIADLKQWLLTHNVAIVGGSDNNDRVRFHYGEYPILPRDERAGELICKKDGDWWILFNKRNGAKIRFSFNDDATPYVKGASPELIDIKITDFCPHGCKFCYQGSTAHGKHAEISSLPYYLESHGVFEVAIGGGEPTLHPQFIEFIETLHRRGIVPNFTTFNADWTFNTKILDAVKRCCGRIAVSVTHQYKIEEIYERFKQCDLHDKFSVQYVLGTGDHYSSLESILLTCNRLYIPITLLGYKTTGRGGKFKPKEHDENWVQLVKKTASVRVGIDTACANQYADQLKGVPHLLINRHEGAFSCYIDAVNNKMGASSYCPQEEMVPFSEREFLKNWELIQPTERTGIVNPGFVKLGKT